ncbi:MAG: hypothetical protein FWE95_04100 [Planctomycetaceae bacterium]|nr:hypothetical protein [Planctomycetaceae bacterium]
MDKQHDTPFPDHARKQLLERYGVEFTERQWFHFGRTLSNPKWTIRLSDAGEGCHFCACYFMEHWYLLIRTRDGTVRTAYPRWDIADEDKRILLRNERYRQINNDEFQVWRNPIGITKPSKTVELPPMAELPDDVSQSAEKMLQRACD